ncbi:MAG TPA: protein kinase [Pirellulaceae bacterium]|nr:protein kinase [Pirellulaceae bacterium]
MDLEQPQATSLAELVRDTAWPAQRSLAVIIELTHQVSAWHARGRLHGNVRLAAIHLDDDGRLELVAPPGAHAFGGQHCALELCPPELIGDNTVRLPADLAAADVVLHKAGVALDARRIDVYQIAAVLCQLITGKSVDVYANSLRLKSTVPAELRAILDRGLGFDSLDRLQHCAQLAELLDAAFVGDVNDAGASQGTPAEGNVVTSDTDIQPPGSLGSRASGSLRLPFERLAHFRLLSVIGRGGMGEVYRAFDEKLERIVAVKVLRHDLAGDESFIRRFQSEAHVIARLPHPNLLPLYYSGEEHGRRFFVMRFIEGESLADRLRNTPLLPVPQVLQIAAQCLSALAAAHDEGLIHRDIKPANVLLEAGGEQAYLVDFGLARRMDDDTALTRTGVVMGTVEYLSPEQARGTRQVDQRSDLYSLGVMLYQMLAGQLPFAADSAVGWIFQHAHEAPLPLDSLRPELPTELVNLVTRLLAKNPEERPLDCREVLQTLQRMQANQVRTRQLASEVAAYFDAGQEATSEPAEWEAPVAYGLLQRARDRAATLLRRNSPAWLERLNSTEQQVDGAIAIYARRQRRVVALLREAREIAQLLRAQLQLQHAAVAQAATKSEQQVGEQQAHEIQTQLQPLEAKCHDLELEAAKISATLLRLQARRDNLRARLAVAQPAPADAPALLPGVSNWLWPVAALLLGAVGLPAALWLGGYWHAPSGAEVAENHAAEIVPPAAAPRLETPLSGSALDREHVEVAKLVIGVGGFVTVQELDKPVMKVTAIDSLPAVFRIVEVNLDRCKNVTPEVTTRIARLSDVKVVNLLHSRIDDATAAPLASMSQLKRLDFGDTAVTGEVLQKFVTMPDLQTIVFGGSFQGESLAYFDKFPNLEYAYICWTSVDDEGLAHLPQLPKLTALWFLRTQIQGDGLVHLARLPALHDLNLAVTPLTPDGLTKLTAYQLQKLNLDETAIGDESIEHLSRFTNLRKLSLQKTRFTAAGIVRLQAALPACEIIVNSTTVETPLDGDSIDSENIEVAKLVIGLGGNVTVNELDRPPVVIANTSSLPPQFRIGIVNLARCKGVTPELTTRIARLPDVTEVNLSFTRIHDEALLPLARMSQLHWLDCGDTAIVGQSLREFVTMPKLKGIVFAGDFQSRYLDQFVKFTALEDAILNWTSIDDEGLASLPEMPTVKKIWFAHTNITGIGLGHLKRLPALLDLGLPATPLTSDGLQKLTIYQLEKLNLDDTAIGDESIEHLCQFTKLRSLSVKNTRFTVNGIAKLQAALPACQMLTAPGDEMLEDLSWRLSQNPRDAGRLRQRALLHQQWQRWDRAADDYEAYLAINTQDTWVRLEAAQLSLAAGREERYLTLCKEAEEALFSGSTATPWVAHATAARILALRPGACQQSEALLGKAQAFAEQDKNFWVLAPQASLLMRLGRYDEALAVAQQVLDAGAGDGFQATAWLRKAEALHHLQRPLEAQVALAKAKECLSQFPPPGDKRYLSHAYLEFFILLPEVERLFK